MDEDTPRDSSSPIFGGLSPQFQPSSRRTRRRLIVAVTSALPILAAASASWVAGASSLPALDPTQQPPVPPEPTPEELMDATSILGHQDHTVVEGESLTSIAQIHGIPTAALLALNGLSWQTSVHEGQVLVVSKQHREPAAESSARMPDLRRSDSMFCDAERGSERM
jgi:LysM repeat protein